MQLTCPVWPKLSNGQQSPIAEVVIVGRPSFKPRRTRTSLLPSTVATSDALSPLPLLAFDFGSSGMLWFLAAAAAPILIHLWNRRNRRTITWAAMEYLLAAIKQKSRRIVVQNWLLLAVRTLLVILVALAIAKPYIESMGRVSTGPARALRILVLDASYSMGTQAGEAAAATRFQRAKDIAAQIVEQSPQGDGFALVVMAEPPRVIIGHPVFEPGNVLAEIEKLQLSHGGGDLSATLQRVFEVASAARKEHPELAPGEAVFITDLGRTSWGLQFASEQAERDFREQARRLAEQVPLRVVNLGENQRENAAVSDLRMDGTYATAGRDVQLEATVRNFGRQELVNRPLQWLVDGRGVGESTVSAEASGQATVPFRYRFETPGLHTLEARLLGDPLAVDNRRFLVVPVKRDVRVLCIEGRPSADPGPSYLEAALASPQASAALAEPIRVDVGGPAALTTRDLSQYDVVYLNNIPQFSRVEASVLREYLLAGGGLVFFLGDQVRSDNYNLRLGGADPQQPRILPARLAEAQPFDPTQQPFVLDPHDYRHPMLKVFRGNEQVGFLRTPIFRYWQLERVEPSAAQTVLSLVNGDPLIVEEAFGAGTVIVVGTPAEVSPSDPWNLMPALQNFVPLVRELLKTAMAGQFRHRNLEVGQSLRGVAPRRTIGDKVEITTPEEQTATATIEAEGDRGGWSFTDTAVAGIYSAQVPGEPSAERFAVNLDTRESDLTPADPQELLTRHFSGTSLQIRGRWEPEAVAEVQTLVPAPRYLQGWLLLGALALLFADSFLAWFFGSRQA